jgi:hypothetical protein
MAGAVAEMSVSGLRELQRAFAKIDKDLAKTVRAAIVEAGGPVRESAETLAETTITNIGPRWGRMRLGVTFDNAYIAPATRARRGSPRPAFGALLLRSAMLPALEKHENSIESEVTKAYDALVFKAGFH